MLCRPSVGVLGSPKPKIGGFLLQKRVWEHRWGPARRPQNQSCQEESKKTEFFVLCPLSVGVLGSPKPLEKHGSREHFACMIFDSILERFSNDFGVVLTGSGIPESMRKMKQQNMTVWERCCHRKRKGFGDV